MKPGYSSVSLLKVRAFDGEEGVRVTLSVFRRTGTISTWEVACKVDSLQGGGPDPDSRRSSNPNLKGQETSRRRTSG
jgi:hypothetical protein